MAPIGGFALLRRSKVAYPPYTPNDSNRGWHGGWFYIWNLVEAPFPKFTKGRLTKKDSWTWGPASKQVKRLGIVEEELTKLVQEDLNGLRVFDTFIRRRIAPLGERARPMWKYAGPSDRNRVSPVDLLGSEVMARID